MSTSNSNHPGHPISPHEQLPRRSVQAGYCDSINNYQCALEKTECLDHSSFRSSREMQGAPERAHGGVCLLSESTLGKHLGFCAETGTAASTTTSSSISISTSVGFCSPNQESCMNDDDIFIEARKPHEKNESGCVVESTKFGRCGEDRCAWSADDCQEGESWTFPDMGCSCEKVQVGGCQKIEGTEQDDKSVYCAVSSDACDSKSTFLNALEVENAVGYQCFLCREFAEEEGGVVSSAAANDNGDSVTKKEEEDFSYSNSADEDTVSTLIAYIDKYPEARISGASPRGSASMSFYRNGDITIEVNANHLSPGCSSSISSNTNKNNGCGISIHSGKSCDKPSFVEGHYYYDSGSSDEVDPWTNVKYGSDVNGLSTSRTMEGSTSGHIVILKGNGYDAADNLGRAVVIRDANGRRIGCGLLQYKDDGEISSSSVSISSSMTSNILIGGGIGAGVGVIIVFLFTFILFRKIHKNEKENKGPNDFPPKTLELEEKSVSTKDDELDDISIL